MQLIRRLNDYQPDRPVALAIGNFDGLHLGHQAVLGRMQALAAEHGLTPAVLTFEPHPRQFFAPHLPPFRLQTLHDKLTGLRAAGVDKVFALKFDAAFAALSAEAFLESVLHTGMRAQAVVTGENFAFGKGRAGTTLQLQEWGRAHGIHSEAVAPVMAEGDVCSSTAVRHALGAGDMAHASALLGRPYTLSGRVRHGQKKGRELGYPTANILPAPMLKLPRYGVYAVRTTLQGQKLEGVANIGVRPTMPGVSLPQLEVHWFDYAGDLYGKRLDVQLLTHLRDEKRFDSLAALTHQIAEDAHAARTYLQEHRP